ncbi:2-phospho-L-lactate guanylyltransferase [Micromonospora cathayae]|uniref:Phosphoenolpyruvate guanylyltransferase n=1 Tax=Micromonospora cathayae TaxID=3028804 RepID=A0ABY7ZWF9_9ACTN|nr:2-phospho-L-lactate guanylyltransferase [Micromonospora sp. HUAS 3]WDZ87396.1 2-phospho-L-lactate guanylyltransferase [Micromonospora sp. HUAS 3]
MTEPSWTVVVPVKRLEGAKSRLRGALPGVPHEALALALALDTVDAVLACDAVGAVLVVTDDTRVAAAVRAAGARVLPDAPDAGPDAAARLNAALRHGAATAGGGLVAGLTADLPALRPAELGAALRAAGHLPGVRHFVADAPGDGTVLLAAPAGVPLDPRFGVGSAAAHAASGALSLAGAWPTLRRDVDTPADLAVAAGLGLGPRTATLAAGCCPTPA